MMARIKYLYDSPYIAYVTLSLSGMLTLQKYGKQDTVIFKLNNYEAESKTKLNDFISSIAVINLNSQKVEVGGQISGDFTSTTIVAKSPLEYEATCEPVPLDKKYAGWHFGGNLGFVANVKFEPQKPNTTSHSLIELSINHEMHMIGEAIFKVFATVLTGLAVAAVIAGADLSPG
jgi:hypothetical protein